MIDLIQDLDNATDLLGYAIRQYLNVCTTIQDSDAPGGMHWTLADRIAEERIAVESHELELLKAKSILGRARNHSLPTTTINSLPPEILVRIFHLVTGSRPCGVKDTCGSKITLPRYPDFLSHVCSNWCRLALNTPTLWTHIDHVPFHSLSQGFDARAFTFLARASGLPLEIHIYQPHYPEEYDHLVLLQFLDLVMPQIRSFELVFPESCDELSREDNEILCHCFQRFEPGTLTKLNLTYAGEMAPWQIEGAYEPDDVPDGLWLVIDPPELDAILSPVRILRLDVFHFPWTDVAYDNLVELRLTSSRKPAARITESELIDLLNSSPSLRILHFGLEITYTDPQPKKYSTLAVSLPCLEVLDVTSMIHNHVHDLTRLFASQRQPLQFSLELHNPSLPVYSDKLLEFVLRSQISKLRVVARGSYVYHEDISVIHKLHQPMPRLRELVLVNFWWRPVEDLSHDARTYSTRQRTSRLDTLYLINCSAHLEELEEVIERHPLKRVVVWNCRVWDRFDRAAKLSPSQLKLALSILGPLEVTVTQGGSSPVENWD